MRSLHENYLIRVKSTIRNLLEISCIFCLTSLNFFRLIAQIHDELLFEVEDSQIQEFSGKYNLFLSPSPFPNRLSFFLNNIEYSSSLKRII